MKISNYMQVNIIDNSFYKLFYNHIIQDKLNTTDFDNLNCLLIGSFQNNILENCKIANFDFTFLINPYENKNNLQKESITDGFKISFKDLNYDNKISLSFSDNYFSSAVSLSNFYFINIQQAQLITEEISRVLVPGSKFLIQFIESDKLSLLRRYTPELDSNLEFNLENQICYYNESKILRLLEPRFQILDMKKSTIKIELKGNHQSYSSCNVIASKR